MTTPEAELRTCWCRLAGLRAGSAAAAPLDELLARLREPHRRYHSATHVMWVLRHLDDLLVDAGPEVDQEVVRWAALYHDAVYAADRRDNEARSAELAEREALAVGWPAERATATARLVRATATHEPHAEDEAILIDADLAVLGGTAPEYAAYARAVRAEYGHLSDKTWRNGRAAVLRHFLAAPTLFHTLRFRTQREARARANIAAELAGLEAVE